MVGGGLEELLLGDLHETGVYDLAADLGIVQHGQLQEGAHDGWPDSTGLSPPPPLPLSGLTPPPPPSLAAAIKPPQLPPSLLHHHVGPAEMEAANDAVSSCLEAAEAAAVALRRAGMQLKACSSQDLPSPTEVAALRPTVDSTRSPGKAAAGTLDQLQGERGCSTGGGGDGGAAAAASKRKRSAGRRGSSMGGSSGNGDDAVAAAAAAAGATSGSVAVGGGVGGAASRQGPGKGLRHFSLKVCEKVESKGDTTYEEVANELIADLAAEVAAGLLEQVHDEKNIRRRVYDALNVLEAIGMIAKNKKAIQWRGWPSGLGRSSEDRLRAEKAKALEQAEEKRQALQDAMHKAYCLANLILRNREAPLPLLLEMRETGVGVPNPLTLPFMLVQADHEAEVEVQISEDNLNAHINFQHWPFVLYDDDHVMRMLNLHLPQPQLYRSLPAEGEPSHGGHMPQPHLQQQQKQQHQQVKQEPKRLRPPHSLLRSQGQADGLAPPPPPLSFLLPMSEERPVPQHAALQQQQQQQQYQQQVAELPGVVPRFTPQKPAGRLPTPALQLSPDIGSPTGPLGCSVSTMVLGSPPATAARSSGRGTFGQHHMHRPQQPLLRPVLVPAAAAPFGPGSAVKSESFSLAAAGHARVLLPAGGSRVASVSGGAALQVGWPQWAAAGTSPGYLPASSEPLQQRPPALLPVPQLRLATLDTLHLGMQQQPTTGAAPQLRPAHHQP